jgi:hypothetical protein
VSGKPNCGLAVYLAELQTSNLEPKMFKMKRVMTATWSIAAASMCAISAALMPNIVVADLNVPALACQAPYLDQAEPMRWHEHYLMNPPDNRGTWVVCPLPIETNNMNATFMLGAFGNYIIGHTPEQAFCYLNVIDLANQHLEGFIPNPGQKKIYTRLLDTRNPQNTLWSVQSRVTMQEVVNAIGQTCQNAADCWGVSLNCYLPSGYGLNMVSQW